MPRVPILSTFAAALALASGGALFLAEAPAEAQQTTKAAKPEKKPAASEATTKPGRTYGSSVYEKDEDQRAFADLDTDVLHAQVLLDRYHFSPGVVDGREGKNFTSALKGYQEAHGLEMTGTLDTPTRKSLLRDKRRPTRMLRIDETEFGSPFKTIPDDASKQAALEKMGYESLLEEIAERFHTTTETLIALNGDKARNVKIGSVLQLPNVLPASRDYGDMKPEYRDMFNALNVQPAPAKRGVRIEVDKSDGQMRVYDKADMLVAQFPVTTGSENDPLPLGDWKVTTFAFLPPFHYQPDLFWDVEDSKDDEMLPPGPNGPVGVAWLDLTKEHYGIHGTPEPQTIGYAESHGCLRMTNWDVLTLSKILDPGFKAKFVA